MKGISPLWSRFVFGLLLLLNFSMSTAVVAPAVTPKPGSNAWYSFCEEMQQVHASAPSSSLTYTELGNPILDQEEQLSNYWMLNIDDVSIPVPDTEFATYTIYRDAVMLDIRLSSDSGINFSFLVKPSKKYIDAFGHDFFVPSSLKPNEASSQEHIRLTEKYFGGPITRTELGERSFRMTPENLECRNSSIERDQYYLVLLAHKAVTPIFATGETYPARAFHLKKDDGRHGYITTGLSSNAEKVAWAANFVQKDFEYGWYVYLPVDRADRHGFLGLAFLDDGNVSEKPTWAEGLENRIRAAISSTETVRYEGLVRDL